MEFSRQTDFVSLRVDSFRLFKPQLRSFRRKVVWGTNFHTFIYAKFPENTFSRITSEVLML